MSFDYAGFPHRMRDDLVAGQREVWARLAAPGTWWTGEERIAIARSVRAARVCRADTCGLGGEVDAAQGELPTAAVEAAQKIAAEPHKLDREWCHGIIEQLGDAAYVELVSIAACIAAIDQLAEALGAELEPLPEPVAGEPSRERPAGAADDGAWVPMIKPWVGPNVARALSLVPDANRMFMSVVGPMYAGGGFAELVWADRPLARPQVELIAARVAAVNECFY